MTKEEKVRLFLVAESDDGSRIRPKYCCIYTFLQLLCFSVFLLFLIFIAKKVIQIQSVIKGHTDESVADIPEDTIPGSDFCKAVNAENMSLVALGYLKAIKEEKDEVDANNKIYYLTDQPFTDQEACAIEALLRLFQDKSVFVVEIENLTATKTKKSKTKNKETNETMIDYNDFLQNQYTNLNRITSTSEKFFKGSPFQNHFKSINSFSIFAAKVLLVWQFGGTVLSPKYILLNRRVYDHNEGFCEVDKELLFCPNQCSAYVYQLVKTILDLLRKEKPEKDVSSQETHDWQESIIDKSVIDYCGNKESVLIGCVGVNRIKKYNVCEKPDKDCDFLRVQEWKCKDPSWKRMIQKFCPKVVRQFFPEFVRKEHTNNS